MSQTHPFAYTWTPSRPIASAGSGVRTSRTEVVHIGIAFAVLTVDLAFLFSGSSLLFGLAGLGLLTGSWAELVGVAAAAAITGFIAHEFAHKIVAERRGYWAEFRMSLMGLALSFVTVFLLGILWAAPGATVVSGMSPADREGWGRTSIAGPLTNVAFASLFYVGSLATFNWVPVASGALLVLAFINGWWAAFNLIPFGPLDGRKVLSWNAGYWAVVMAGTGALAAICWVALFYYGSPLLAF
jgi:Zn-dependent protease